MTKTNTVEMDDRFLLNFVTLGKILLLWLPTQILSQSCTQTGPCSCKSSKGVLDLSPLTSPNPNPSLKAQGSGYEYTYMPCVPSNAACIKAGSSLKVAICQQSEQTATEQYVVGETQTAVFGSSSSSDLHITYFSNDKGSGINRTGNVKLICKEDADKAQFKFIDESPTLTYNFELTSQYACFKSEPTGGLSTGSVLVIIFFVLVIVYIVGGILFMHYVKGAEGVEKFPNLEFWKEFPLLVRDGVLFVVRGCKTDTTYSKI